jgi:hypothetical protein
VPTSDPHPVLPGPELPQGAPTWRGLVVTGAGPLEGSFIPCDAPLPVGTVLLIDGKEATVRAVVEIDGRGNRPGMEIVWGVVKRRPGTETQSPRPRGETRPPEPVVAAPPDDESGDGEGAGSGGGRRRRRRR